MVVAWATWILPVAVGTGLLVAFAPRWRPCPPGRLLVVYGKYLPRGSVVQDRGRFVLPVVQGYSYLSLEPIDLPGGGRVRIGREPALTLHAALHLLNLPREAIAAMASEALRRAGDDRVAAARGLAAIGLERCP